MHPKAYAIVEKESGKIESVHLRKKQAEMPFRKPYYTYTKDEYAIIPVEIKKLKK